MQQGNARELMQGGATCSTRNVGGSADSARYRRATDTDAHVTAVPCEPVHAIPSVVSLTVLCTVCGRMVAAGPTQAMRVTSMGRGIVTSVGMSTATTASERSRSHTSRRTVRPEPDGCSGRSSMSRVQHRGHHPVPIRL